MPLGNKPFPTVQTDNQDTESRTPSPNDPPTVQRSTMMEDLHQTPAQRRHGSMGSLESQLDSSSSIPPRGSSKQHNGDSKKIHSTPSQHWTNPQWIKTWLQRIPRLDLYRFTPILLKLGLLKQRPTISPTSPSIPREFAKGHVSHEKVDKCTEFLSKPFFPYTISWIRLAMFVNLIAILWQLIGIIPARKSCSGWEGPWWSPIKPCDYPGGGKIPLGYVPHCENKEMVPRVAHFVLFPPHRFSFVNYLAIKSAKTFLGTELILLHIVQPAPPEAIPTSDEWREKGVKRELWHPSGLWWDMISPIVTISRVELDPVAQVKVDSKRFPFALDYVKAGMEECHPEDGTQLYSMYHDVTTNAPLVIQRELEYLLAGSQALYRSGGVWLGLTTILTSPLDSLLTYKTVAFQSEFEAEFKRNLVLSAPQTEMMYRWKRALGGWWYTMDGWVGTVDGKGGWRTLLNRIARFNPEEMTVRDGSEIQVVESSDLSQALKFGQGLAVQVITPITKTDWKNRQEEWSLVRKFVNGNTTWMRQVFQEEDLMKLKKLAEDDN